MKTQSFIEAVRSNNTPEINRWHELVSTSLISYLQINFRAPLQDAQDCAQDALTILVEAIQNGDEMPEKPGSYIRTIARNQYFKVVRKNSQKVGDEVLDYEEDGLDPAEILIDNEMKKLLHFCIRKLDELQQKIVNFWLANPGIRSEEVATNFKMTVSNIWVRRHRINKQLEACLRKNM